MKNLEDVLEKISKDGIIMSRETVELKNMELSREFIKFEQDYLAENNINPEAELDDVELVHLSLSIYKGWVGHKLAVYDLTLGKILDFLNG